MADLADALNLDGKAKTDFLEAAESRHAPESVRSRLDELKSRSRYLEDEVKRLHRAVAGDATTGDDAYRTELAGLSKDQVIDRAVAQRRLILDLEYRMAKKKAKP